MAALAILNDPDQTATVLHPVRRQVLSALTAPGSATTVGEALGLPRQKVNYHLRALESAGLVEHVEDRRKGNCTERVVQATARHYLIAPSVLGGLEPAPDEVADQLSADHLAAMAGRTVSELAELTAGAKAAKKRLPTISLETAVRFASPAAYEAFTAALTEQIATLVSEYHDDSAPDGRWFRVLAGAHPARRSRADEEKTNDRS